MKTFSFSETKKHFEDILEKEAKLFSEKTMLSQACQYALLSGGKRLRPLIIYLIAEALNSEEDLSSSALCIEFFHTASLIADDLPCMDNDDYRREKPSVHKKFGEATALLASYGLITAAFEKIYESAQKSFLEEKEKRCLIALKEVSAAAGVFGTLGGQYLDLFCKNPTLIELKEIIEKKTVRLFEVTFVLGWLFAGGNIRELEKVKQIGYHFGFAFQIADDIKDLKQDALKENPINIALYLGKEKAQKKLEDHFFLFLKQLEVLKIKTEGFLKLSEKLFEQETKK